MKTEIQRSPITFNGEDGYEVLYMDYDLDDEEVCEYCMYENWLGWSECAASCAVVHGCGLGSPTYFQFIK